MKFTFGIVSDFKNSNYLQKIVDSICDENIPEFEIVIVGGNQSHKDDIMTVIPFDETKRQNWITRKKNIITETARYENIVYMHDYILLLPGWYNGFLQFGSNFTVCMNKIKNADNTRFRDWCLYKPNSDEYNIPDPQLLLPYEFKNLSHLMYISGTYWVAKRNIMQNYPLCENLSWGESEDIEWSLRVRPEKFYLNEFSTVKTLKWKPPIFIDPTPSTKEILKTLNNT